MESKLVNVAILLVFIAGTIDSAEPYSKMIQLSEVTPQGILHLTSASKQGLDGCDYWVTISPEIAIVSKNLVGISVGLLGMELLDNASIKVTHHSDSPSGEDEATTARYEGDRTITKSCEWEQKAVSYYPKTVKAECMQANNNDVCIRLQGNWTGSRADLLLNVYYDYDDITTCPEGTTQCSCNKNDDDSSEEELENSHVRCIPDDLRCNGVSNCGLNCVNDESEHFCDVASYQSDTCIWTKFEYLAMMGMTGLLLLLIPVLLFLTCMYHRRRPPTPSPLNGLPSHYDSNNNRTSTMGRYPHVISTVPVNLDPPPPNYEDLPDDIKIPMHSPTEQTEQERNPN